MSASTDVATGVFHPRAAEVAEPRVSERLIAWLYGGTALAVVGLMGVAGLAMRFTQADLLGLSPGVVLPVDDGSRCRHADRHAPGDDGRALVRPAAVGCSQPAAHAVELGLDRARSRLRPRRHHRRRLCDRLDVPVLRSPFHSAGQWSGWATGTFFIGLILVGVGFAVFCIDVLAKTTTAYGGLLRALGVPYLRGRDDDPPPPRRSPRSSSRSTASWQAPSAPR